MQDELYRIFSRRKIDLITLILIFGVFFAGLLEDKGIILGGKFDFYCILTIFIIFFIVFIFFLQLFRGKYIFFIVFCVGFLVYLSSSLSFSNIDTDNLYKFATISSIVKKESKVEIFCISHKSDSFTSLIFNANIKLTLNLDNSSIELDYDVIGKKILLPDDLKVPDKASNPGGFDYRKNLYGKGIGLIGYINPEDLHIKGESGVWYKIKSLIYKSREDYLKLISPDSGEDNLASGILFGITDEISEETSDIFTGSGIGHILAVSGLHIGMIYSLYLAIIKRFNSPRITLAFILFLLVYGTSAMWSSSVTRAIGLIFLKLYSSLKMRKYDLLSALSAISIPLVILRPFIIYSSGFIMSFLAAIGMAVVVPRLRGHMPDFLISPIGVQVLLIPYMVEKFNVLSLGSIPANFLIISIASLYVYIGVSGYILYGLLTSFHWYLGHISLISPIYFNFIKNILNPFGRVLDGLGEIICRIAKYIYMDGKTALIIPSQGILSMIIVITVIFIGFSETRMLIKSRGSEIGKRVIILFLIPVMVLLGFLSRSPFSNADQVFIDVGQGDSFHLSWDEKGSKIKLMGDRTLDILIDGGGRYNSNIGKNILRGYFLHGGKWNVDLALATHEHMDHYKGLKELMECYDVKEILLKGAKGDVIRFDNERYIEILWPLEENIDSNDENYFSRVYMVHDRGIKTLITGDITEEGEKALLVLYANSDELSCNILKVAHHGSKYSSSTDFLMTCNPDVAVISVGKNNYGHPSLEVIEKMRSMGIMVYRTDIDGAVGIIIDRKGFKVCTQKTGKLDNYSCISK